MCTALTLQTQDGYNLFGRNMDIEFSFSQSILLSQEILTIQTT